MYALYVYLIHTAGTRRLTQEDFVISLRLVPNASQVTLSSQPAALPGARASTQACPRLICTRPDKHALYVYGLTCMLYMFTALHAYQPAGRPRLHPSIPFMHALYACLCLISMPYMHALYACLICMLYMHALYACLCFICMLYMHAFYACSICMFYMHAYVLLACLICMSYMHVLYASLYACSICMPMLGMHALYACFICIPMLYMHAVYACLCFVCMLYMHALYACLQRML